MPPAKRKSTEGENPPDNPVQLPKKRPKFKYAEAAMEAALKAVREGMTSRKASREFGVPFSTLQYKVKGKAPEGRRMGPATILTTDEEDILVRYVVANAKKGFPLNKKCLVETVQNIVTDDKRPNPFSNNKPGHSWVTAFLKRHPGLTQCHAEVINRGRAQVTEEKLRGWADDLQNHLREEKAEDILEDGSRIFNLDESGFRTNPDSGLVLGPVNYNNFYVIKDGSEKESITTLVTVNADGDILPPMVVFPYVRIPLEIARSCNPDWALGRSPSGWMTGQTFFCFIGNTFIPWIKSKNIKMPVLLLIDGHKSHLTLNVCRLCKANGIILYALLPNATHIIQPLDVSVFRAMKAGWSIVVEEWKRATNNKVLTRAKFLRLFEQVLNERVTSQIIKNGFRKCGLFPFNPNNIDFTKCISDPSRISETGQAVNFISAKPGDFGIPQLLFVESCMGGRAEEFRGKEKTGWDGEESAREMFELWKRLRKKCITISSEHEDKTEDPKGNSCEEGREEANENDKERNLIVDQEENNGDKGAEIINGDQDKGEVLHENQDATNTDQDEGEVVDKDQDKERSTLEGSQNTSTGGTPTKTVITPQKIPECKPPNISPAFLGHIVWPIESPIKRNNQRGGKQKERLPHAATSKKWLNYWENIEDEKKKKEEEKQRKKNAREDKKNSKTDKPKKCNNNGEPKQSSSKKNIDWNCPKCKGSYNMDVEMSNGRKWIGPCNDCDSWYHKHCISKKLVLEFGLNDISDDEESDFVCDICFGQSDDDNFGHDSDNDSDNE